MQSAKFRKLCTIAVLLLPVIVALTLSRFGLDSPVVEHGVADFRKGIDNSRLYELNGKWQFFDNLEEALVSGNTGKLINVPRSWTSAQTLEHPLPAFATVVYKLTILLPENHPEKMGFVTDLIRSANEVYVNGKQLGSEGDLTEDAEQFVAFNRPKRYEFSATGKVEIVIRVANYLNSASAGIITPIGFGSCDAVESDRRVSIEADTFVVAAFFLALLMFVGMYFQRIYQRELLYFSLYCCCSAFTFSLENERIFFDLFPTFSYVTAIRIDFVASLAAFFFIALYTNTALERPVGSVFKSLSVVGIAGIVFGVFAPVSALTWVGPLLFMLNAVFAVYLVFILISAINRGLEGSGYLTFGLVCFAMLVILMAGNFYGKINDVKSTAAIMPLFLASQLLFIGERHRKSYVRKRMEAAELAYLRAQVNPHFIYNMLGTISCLVEDEPRSAQDALVDFSVYLRKLLKPAAAGVFATVREEMELVEYYLKLEKMRFGERLIVVINVEQQVLEYQLPQLSLQPLVENAVKHGLMARSAGGKVTVTGRLIEKRAHIKIIDTGQGMSREKIDELITAQSKGIGLQNTRERVLRYGGEFNIDSDSCGTRIEIVTAQ